jgi:hypothetical protein
MSYKEILKQQIKELQLEISNKRDHKEVLENRLQDLMKKEFEEDLREEADRKTLLKG